MMPLLREGRRHLKHGRLISIILAERTEPQCLGFGKKAKAANKRGRSWEDKRQP